MALQSGGNARDKLAAGTTAQRPAGLASADMGSVRYNSSTGKMEYWNGTEWKILMIDQVIGNGQINVNQGTGISISGTNATANQTGNTTRTVAVDTTWIDNRINGKIGNGQINVNPGNGLSGTGSNATANQGGNTTRTLSVKAANNSINVGSGGISVNWGAAPGGGGTAAAWCCYDAGGNPTRQSGVASKENHSNANYMKYYNLTSSPGLNAAVVVSGPTSEPSKGNHGRMKTASKVLLKYDNNAHSTNTGGTGEPDLNKHGSFAVFG